MGIESGCPYASGGTESGYPYASGGTENASCLSDEEATVNLAKEMKHFELVFVGGSLNVNTGASEEGSGTLGGPVEESASLGAFAVESESATPGVLEENVSVSVIPGVFLAEESVTPGAPEEESGNLGVFFAEESWSLCDGPASTKLHAYGNHSRQPP